MPSSSPRRHAIGVGHLVLGVDRIALFERLPRAFVAHDDRIDHPIGIEGILVLAQDADLALAGPRSPFCGSSSPDRTFMKVDLPAPFGPVSPKRRPAMKVDRNLLEQELGSVTHSDIGD
jgi:hypothetical protein